MSNLVSATAPRAHPPSAFARPVARRMRALYRHARLVPACTSCTDMPPRNREAPLRGGRPQNEKPHLLDDGALAGLQVVGRLEGGQQVLRVRLPESLEVFCESRHIADARQPLRVEELQQKPAIKQSRSCVKPKTRDQTTTHALSSCGQAVPAATVGCHPNVCRKLRRIGHSMFTREGTGDCEIGDCRLFLRHDAAKPALPAHTG